MDNQPRFKMVNTETGIKIDGYDSARLALEGLNNRDLKEYPNARIEAKCYIIESKGPKEIYVPLSEKYLRRLAFG